jgi:hypothetical protein
MVGALIGTAAGAITSIGCQDAPGRLSEALPALRLQLDHVRCGAAPAPAGRPKLERIAGMNVWLPPGLAKDEPYDVVVHFHGHPAVVADGYRRSGVRAVVAIVNMGISSAVYEHTFKDRARFAKIRRALRKGLERRGWRSGERRLVLSSFSAGYAALRSLLRDDALEREVDAIIMLDGMHASLDRAGTIETTSIAPFVRFAERAARGEKLMVVTHSQIETRRYASTTRAVDAVLEAVHVPGREREGVVRGKALGGTPVTLARTREARGGALHVAGFEGNDADGHSKHLLGAGEIAFAKLARHWNCPGPNAVASVAVGRRAVGR